MHKSLKNIGRNLKKSWPSIASCFVIVGLSLGTLGFHYNSRAKNREDVVYQIESKFLDWKIRNRGPIKAPTKVGILAIDEKSLAQFGRWPFSRRYYGQAFDNLKKIGVKWVGFDAVWAESEKTFLEDAQDEFLKMDNGNLKKKIQVLQDMVKLSPSDVIFSRSIKSFENIVLGFFHFGSADEAKSVSGRDPFLGLSAMASSAIQNIIMPEGKTLADYRSLKKAYGIVANTELYSEASKHFAFFGNDADDDAINRWVTLLVNMDGALMPSLALKTAAEYLESDILVVFNNLGVESILLSNRADPDKVVEIPIDANGVGRVLVNHRGPGQAFHFYSLADAYNNTFSKEDRANLDGSLLLLGATATGINDMRPNPFDPSIDGAENHAAVLDNILTQNFFKRPLKMYDTELLVVLLVGLLFSPLMIWGKAVISGVATCAFLVGYYYFDKLFWFKNGVWAYCIVPWSEVSLMFVFTTVIKYISEEKDKKFLKQAFGSYISPELIDEMHSSGAPPKLGGDMGILTAYFTDIQGFSSFSELLNAQKLVELLNEYLTVMTDILMSQKGTLDKYEGDAIIAFFGAPMKLEDHAVRACTVAVRMQEGLDQLRVKWVSEGDKWPNIVKEMRMRIGINSGEIVTGNMGSRDRMNYTMMGDSVNLAARLEEAAKQYGIFSHVTHFTKALLGDKFDLRELDTIRVVGKKEPVTTYDILGIVGESSPTLLNLMKSFHEGLAMYKAKKWDTAIEAFNVSLNFEYERFPTLKGKKTNPSLIYIERCNEFKANPPPDNWDGVYTLTSK